MYLCNCRQRYCISGLIVLKLLAKTHKETIGDIAVVKVSRRIFYNKIIRRLLKTSNGSSCNILWNDFTFCTMFIVSKQKCFCIMANKTFRIQRILVHFLLFARSRTYYFRTKSFILMMCNFTFDTTFKIFYCIDSIWNEGTLYIHSENIGNKNWMIFQ